jgi:hypothetical protein
LTGRCPSEPSTLSLAVTVVKVSRYRGGSLDRLTIADFLLIAEAVLEIDAERLAHRH